MYGMEHSWKDYEGQTVNGYPLQEYLGGLDERAAYKTEHEGRAAVVQLVPAAAPDSKRLLESWLHSYELTHPDLVQTYAAGNATLAGSAFVFSVIEYVEDNVSEALTARPLSAEETRQVLEAITSALSFLHAKRFAHGCLEPTNVVAIGSKVKLLTDCLRTASAADIALDMEALGLTLVQMLTQHRPAAGEGYAASQRLQPPFREIAAGCLHPDPEQRWKTGFVQKALRGERIGTSKAAAAPPALQLTSVSDSDAVYGKSRRLPLGIAGALAVLVAIGFFFFRTTPEEDSGEAKSPPVNAPATPRPSPVAESAPASAKEVPAERHLTGVGRRSRPAAGGWAVVAATYNRPEDAERRSATLKKKWPQFEPQVRPTSGDSKRYLVVLATGIDQAAAKQLLARARSAGLPRDTYITRIR
jgi:SPOR domain